MHSDRVMIYTDVLICVCTKLQHGVEGMTVGMIEVTEDEEEDISSYWTTLKEKRGYWKLKMEHYIALCGEFTWEKAVELT